MDGKKTNSAKRDFKLFAGPRIAAAVLVAGVALWACATLIDFFTESPGEKSPYRQAVEKYSALKKADDLIEKLLEEKQVHARETAPAEKQVPVAKKVAEHKDEVKNNEHSATEETAPKNVNPNTEKDLHVAAEKPARTAEPQHNAPEKEKTPEPQHNAPEKEKTPEPQQNALKEEKTVETAPPAPAAPTLPPVENVYRARGNAFVTALIEPINFELHERTLGWRPNDIFTFFTDNVENFQMGVLEVTRRTSEKLVERIARTGSTITFDKDLDQARTKFMNDPKKYWMPSAESAYSKGVESLKKYRTRLDMGKATFHSRADNLLPLLTAYEGLLGDCDENLIKRVENNGEIVSTFKADDYFYYAQGVAKAMAPILEAIMIDFEAILESRGASSDLHHAVLMLNQATELSPLFIQESSLSGFFANHRANMATFIGHARSYLEFVIKTIST